MCYEGRTSSRALDSVGVGCDRALSRSQSRSAQTRHKLPLVAQARHPGLISRKPYQSKRKMDELEGPPSRSFAQVPHRHARSAPRLLVVICETSLGKAPTMMQRKAIPLPSMMLLVLRSHPKDRGGQDGAGATSPEHTMPLKRELSQVPDHCAPGGAEA